MPNKAKSPPSKQDHSREWADDRHRRQSGQRDDLKQQHAEDAPHRQQGGWQSDEEIRREQRREAGFDRDRDYNPDGERPIERR